jgi:hypothetical protein
MNAKVVDDAHLGLASTGWETKKALSTMCYASAERESVGGQYPVSPESIARTSPTKIGTNPISTSTA